MSSYLAQIPNSTVIILLVSIVMAFVSSFVNSHFTPREHREKLKALQRQIAALKREKGTNLKKAKKSEDQKLLKKVRKQEKQLLQLQSQMASLSFRQMRVLPITMITFLLVWMVLTGKLLYWDVLPGLFTGAETVAYLPWLESGTPMELNLFLWYLFNSFLFGTLFSRIFGLTGAIE